MTNYIIIGVVAVVILFVIVYIKMTIDEKKGANSEEKQKVKDIVKRWCQTAKLIQQPMVPGKNIPLAEAEEL